jgi:biotin carboxyl carrier protein
MRAGEATTAFLVDHPPLSPPPLRLPSPAWRGAWRLNLPAPAPQPPPEIEAAAHHGAHGAAASELVAPMPGTVLEVVVAPGDVVQARQRLIVLEAMKMENPIAAPFDGTVKAVHVAAGDRVAGGALLIELEP